MESDVTAAAAADADAGSVPLADALAIGTQLHQQRELAQAEAVYRRILEAMPGQPDALHFLGVLRHDQGDSVTGARLVEEALQQIPEHPDAHNNLGNIYLALGRVADAEGEFHKTLRLRRTDVAALSNLGRVFQRTERYEQAIAAYELLTQLEPGYPYGWHNLGVSLWRGSNRHEEAAACFYKALASGRVDVATFHMLARVLRSLGREAEMADLLRNWLEKVPNDPVVQYLLAAYTGEDVPERANDEYVRRAFDDYASMFDQHLTENLEYRAPEVLAGALQRVLPAPVAALDVLDAGCGTGLCGPLVKPYARRLVGVDLSPRMIAKAEARGYDELIIGELTAYLQVNARAFDVVLSADTLCYFGPLEAVAAAARAAVRPGGWFAFSVEQNETGADHALAVSARYTHSRGYLERTLAGAGFTHINIDAAVLRKEAKQPVHGWVVTAQ